MDSMNRNNAISYAKAICIVLMVLGHAGVPARVHQFSCLFHMPLFFFVSGFLFKEDHLLSFIDFLKKKAKKIWQPYVLWTIFSILIHNAILLPLHIADTEYSFQQILLKCICALGMISTESYLFAGFWFLRDMFYALLVFWCVLRLSKRIRSTAQSLFIPATILLCLGLAIAVNAKWIWIPNVKTSTMLALAYMLTGYLVRHSSLPLQHRQSLWIGLPVMCLVWMISGHFSTSMTIIEGSGDILLYYALSVFAVLGLLFLCDALSRKPMAAISYIGEHSMDILIFHFPAFKGLSYLLIRLKDYPIDDMAKFHIPGYWYYYALIGLALPLSISFLKAFCKTWPIGGKEACSGTKAGKSS